MSTSHQSLRAVATKRRDRHGVAYTHQVEAARRQTTNKKSVTMSEFVSGDIIAKARIEIELEHYELANTDVKVSTIASTECSGSW